MNQHNEQENIKEGVDQIINCNSSQIFLIGEGPFGENLYSFEPQPKESGLDKEFRKKVKLTLFFYKKLLKLLGE